MPDAEPGPCPLCGAPHVACGPDSASVPVDLLTTIPKGDSVLKKYRTTVNGHETTLKLSDDAAKAYDGELTEVSDEQPEAEAETKAYDGELTEVSDEQPEAEAETKARRAPANKSRTTDKD